MTNKIIIAAVLTAVTLMQSEAAHASSHFRNRHFGAMHFSGHRHIARAHHHRFAARARTRSFRFANAVQSHVDVSGGTQVGRASFYSGGNHTASGGSVGAATCAHRSLPFGTKVLITNLANARQAILTVNDRGPFVRGRMLDVSRGAASILGMLHAGVSQIRMQVLGGAG